MEANNYSDSRPRRKGMPLHRFFAWGTIICLFLTMYTGYNKN